MENLNEVKVNELISNNGTEFKNQKLEEFCDEKGISHNFASPCSLEQNGIAERRNETLIKAARTIDHLGKADDGFFVGYSLVARTFRVFNIIKQEMEETYHVTFNEANKVITQTSTKGDEINFNENRSFPDDKFLGYRQEEGIDYDETFALVARLEAIKIFLIYATYMGFVVYQVDVKSAFLNGKLSEEIYMDDVIFRSTNDKRDLLKKYELANCALVKCLMLLLNNLEPDELGVFVNETQFRGMIRYLKGTPNLSLWYLKGSRFDLKAYSDSNYAGCNLDRKSTSRGCQIFGGMSSGPKVSWLTMISMYDKVPIFCDITSAIAISNDLVLHSRIKHIDIRYHFIKDHILKGDIELHFVPTDLQLADIFTKPLAEPSFTRLVVELGMLNIDKVHKTIVEDAVKDPFVTDSGIKSLRNVNFDELLKDQKVNEAKITFSGSSPFDQEMKEAYSDIESMHDDEIMSTSRGYNDEVDSDQELSIVDTKILHSSVKVPRDILAVNAKHLHTKVDRTLVDLHELLGLVSQLVRIVDSVAPPANAATEREKES
nr:hypothetical protein [Tanacetum cinerariifolium]